MLIRGLTWVRDGLAGSDGVIEGWGPLHTP